MDIEIRKYAYAQHPARGAQANVTGFLDLYDAAGKPVARVLFVHAPPLAPAMQDAAGIVALSLWESALPVALDMLRSGAQVYVGWDGREASVFTSLTAVG